MAKIKRLSNATSAGAAAGRKALSIENTLFLEDTFEVYINALKSAGRAKRTLDIYRQYFGIYWPYFRDQGVRSFADLTSDLIRDLLNFWMEDHEQGGVHMVYRNLKAFLNWVWNEYDFTLRNPIDKVTCANRQPIPIPGFTMDEVDQLLKAAKAGQFPQRDTAMIYLFVDTGLRRQELMDLRFKDVDLNIGKIIVMHGKGGKYREVYCGNECRKILRKYTACIEDFQPDDYFFLSDEGFPLSTSGFVSILRRLEKRAGFDGYRGFHGMRRCFALERKRNGDDIYSLQRALGHSSTVVTQRYIAFTGEDDAAAAVRNSPMDNHRRQQRR